MSRRVIKIETEGGKQLWIGGEKAAYSTEFESALSTDPTYHVLSQTTVDQCFGPLSITQEIKSSHGTFTVKAVMEGYDPDIGVSVDASDPDVIDRIYTLLLASGLFHSRS